MHQKSILKYSCKLSSHKRVKSQEKGPVLKSEHTAHEKARNQYIYSIFYPVIKVYIKQDKISLPQAKATEELRSLYKEGLR